MNFIDPVVIVFEISQRSLNKFPQYLDFLEELFPKTSIFVAPREIAFSICNSALEEILLSINLFFFILTLFSIIPLKKGTVIVALHKLILSLFQK